MRVKISCKLVLFMVALGFIFSQSCVFAQSKLPSSKKEDRYSIPDGDAKQLLQFIERLRSFRPTTFVEILRHRQKASAAIRSASERIIQIEKDQSSKVYQQAYRYLLGYRIAEAGALKRTDLRQLVKDTYQFLSTRELSQNDLAMVTDLARSLEVRKDFKLAADLSSDFSNLLKKQKNPILQTRAKLFAGASRRLSLLGKKFERLEGITYDGQPFDWASYRGKVVLIDFWATWCKSCIAELPHLKKAYEAYHGRGFEVVGISIDTDRRALDAFIVENKLPWVTLHNKKGNHPMVDYYGVITTPTMILVDKNGKVVSLRAGGRELDSLLEKLLGSAIAD